MFGWLFGGTDEEKEQLEKEFEDHLFEVRYASGKAHDAIRDASGKEYDEERSRRIKENSEASRRARTWFSGLFGRGGDDSEEHY